jgi:hypothetical protein
LINNQNTSRFFHAAPGQHQKLLAFPKAPHGKNQTVPGFSPFGHFVMRVRDEKIRRTTRL